MVLLVTVLVGLAADLGSKWWAFEKIAPVPQAIDREAVVRVLEHDPSQIMSLINPHEPRVVVPGLLNFQLVLNAGAVFGTGQGKRWFFIGFTAVALCFALWVFAAWTSRRDRLGQIAVGLVVSGGIGNLYDRVRYGCVRDFIHPLPGVKLPFGWHWPSGDADVWPYVSNVADALLLIGIGVLMVKLWRAEKKKS
ncbi:MAG TPA: signal peptidase II [Phycisphaerales bacterium]|nr:signal peptidase II [Phycisphaerales bacterium]